MIGVAFRFPGGADSEINLWSALMGGRDLVTQIDPSRWAVDELAHPRRREPGRSITFAAGTVGQIDGFDAAFFGISPREAELLDPQQRLLLELAWEAMENGGVRPSSLAGTNCAVYVGISGLDYGMRSLDDLSSMSAHSMTGNTMSMAANRLSYVFDLHGPSLAIDTACSSSLVALHHGCVTLASGQSPVALVGGVNLLLHPYPFVGFTKASMISAQGRCAAFAEGGDGYVRSEGGAVLLLKPLSQARADGDHIHAVIRASGVNADGGRKTGLTIPSVEGQTELMRRVLADAGLRPQDVDYIEAHGTGTKVGDPIEAKAIGTVYGQARPKDKPMLMGSVKSNLGHLEPASGLAGLVKALLVLKHGTVPPSIHAETLNTAIDFDTLNLELVRRPLTLPAQTRALRVGVNSFGFGGANAHVILQAWSDPRGPAAAGSLHPRTSAAPAKPLPAQPTTPPTPLFLSAQSDEALRALAQRYLPYLQPFTQRQAVAQAACFQRDWLPERLAIANVLEDQFPNALEAFSQGSSAPGVIRERVLAEPAKVAFVYSGNGAQWVGMGRKLLQASPVFAQTLREVDACLLAHGGPSVLDTMACTHLTCMDDTAVAQPALFAVQVGMTKLLRQLGLDADAAMGHSVGEIAAAWAMGALSLDMAAHVIVARSKAQALTRGSGRMAAVWLGAEAMRAKLVALDLTHAIEIAAENSPRNVTVSGNTEALAALRLALRADGTFYRALDLDYAFHSRCMDPVEQQLMTSLAALRPQPASGRLYSTVKAGAIEPDALDAAYWWHNVRDPVRFGATVVKMAQDGYRVFVEIGPHAVLQRYVLEALESIQVTGRSLSVARRDDDSLEHVRSAVLRAALLGAPVDPKIYFPKPLRQPIALPTYPWQRQRHWYRPTSESYALVERRAVHPLLGYRLKEPPAAWEIQLDPLKQTMLADHKVGGAVVLPGAAYVEMALAASREWFGSSSFVLEGLDIVAPVVFDHDHGRTLRLVFSPADLRFRIEGRERLSDNAWALHAQGRLLGAASAPGPAGPGIPEPPAGATVIDAQAHYAVATRLGLDYGPAFRGIQRLSVGTDTLSAQLQWPSPPQQADAYLLHPAILDQCFQSVLGWVHASQQAQANLTFLPVGVGRLTLWPAQGRTDAAQLRARLVRQSPRSALVDFDILNARGEVWAEIKGARFRAAAVAARDPLPASWTQVALAQALGVDALSDQRISSAELAGDVERALQGQDASSRKRYFDEVAPIMELLPVAYARDVLRAECPAAAPDKVPAGVLQRWREGHPLLHWLVEQLRDEGFLRENPEGWTLDDRELPPTRALWEAAHADFPAAFPELLRIGRVGLRLRKLSEGHDISAELAASSTDEILKEQAPAYEGSGLAAAQAVASLSRRWPEGRRMRILEIGSGGNATHQLLQAAMPHRPVDYVVARSDPERLAQLRAELAQGSDVHVAAFDSQTFAIDLPALAPQRFDVVLVDHVLHRVRQPGRALGELLQHLSPDALLLLAERRPDRAGNFMFGADANWWHDENHAGLNASLHQPDAWIALLSDLGWGDLQVVLDHAGAPLRLGSFVVLGRPEGAVASVVEPATAVPEPWHVDAPHAGWCPLAEALSANLAASGLLAADKPIPDHPPTLPPAHWVLFPTAVGPATPAAVLARDCEALRKQLLRVAEQAPRAEVCIVTQGGALVNEPAFEFASPAAAAIWGMTRVAMNEYPDLRLRLVDLQGPLDDPRIVAALRRELTRSDGEQEVVLGAGARHVVRMQPAHGVGVPPTAAAAAPAAWKLDCALPGQLRNLRWIAAGRPALGDHDIEIRACASGLNFRDVMYAMGLLSDEALEQGFAGAALGLEVAGRVSRCGAGVTRFKPGDDVLAFAGASFASHVVVPERAVALKPAMWSYAEAATVPTVFFTVWYALKHLGQVQPGERLLVHGGAGGVGIAAAQVARLLGAEVFATAGSAEKRDYVKLLGAHHVFDSRSLHFDDAILEATQGQGVDVVLNSLAGEAITRNLRVLRPFGRFLELGKRDFYENTHIGLRPFRNNISYFGVDADQLMQVRPDLATAIFSEVMSLFEQGRLSPLPCRVFAADHAVDAFRHMQHSRQIGKVVIDLQTPPRAIEPEPDQRRFQLRPDATYLVSGGLSGFGLASAQWLVDKGARHLVLLGRRGAQTPGLQHALTALQERGVTVQVSACDVTDRVQLASVLDASRASMPPLRGVIHAAMVLDDGLLANLDADRFGQVFGAKLDGAWNLHELTQPAASDAACAPSPALDFFVLYSSATTFMGNPGQANYVAANAALEALARLRRQQGLPACTVAWGPIADVGVLTSNAVARKALQSRLGAAALPAQQALAMLERLLLDQDSGVAVMNFDWASLERTLPAANVHRFDGLRRHFGPGGAPEGDADLRARLAELPPEEARLLIADALRAEVAEILRLPPQQLQMGQSLLDLGMDSLMAVELALALEKRFGVALPPMLISENPNIDRLADRLLANLHAAPDDEPDPARQLVETLMVQHAETDSRQQAAELIEDIRAAALTGTRLNS